MVLPFSHLVNDLAPSPLSASTFAWCILLCLSSRGTHPAGSPCPRSCNSNQWTSSPILTILNARQQYQGWMLTLLGSAHPIMQAAFCNHALVTKKRMASPLDFNTRNLDSPSKRQSFWFQNRCVLHTVHCSLDSPSATRCMTISTC